MLRASPGSQSRSVKSNKLLKPFLPTKSFRGGGGERQDTHKKNTEVICAQQQGVERNGAEQKEIAQH